jgi:hypothetical protein
MIGIARSLSRDFAFCRVDFFESNGRPYFNEITFHHNSGLKPFKPEKYDRILGDMVAIPPAG